MKPFIQFYEFNLRRYQRKADAVRFMVDQGYGEELLWMSRRDIERNLQMLGPHKELERGLEAYRTRRPKPRGSK